MNLKIKNALISVSNKENLVLLLKTLKKFNINIISSGGTYASIKKLGYKCTELSKYTGFKEILDGVHDDVPEQAFYMVGSIDEVLEKAKTVKND